MLMFKKILSSMTIMLLAFCMNAGAQGLQAHKLGARKITPKFAATPSTSILDLADDETWMGYWNGNLEGSLGLIGMSQTPMHYDAAIGYPAGSANIKGMEITGMRFTFVSAENVENLKVWMSTELPSKAENADIVCDKVTDITSLENPDDPLNEIRFSKSYKVDENKPLYIGYSFDINKGEADGDLYPVITDMGAEDVENAMIVKVGDDEGGWMDYNGIGFGVLAVQALVKGDFPENAVSMPAHLPDITSMVGFSSITFPIENAGKNPLSSIRVNSGAYGFNVTGQKYTFKHPLEGIGAKADVTIKTNMPDIPGMYEFFIEIEEVNGEMLEEPVVTKLNAKVLSEKVQRRPFLEEFTGMWCGWCPRGMVSLEKIKGLYGDDVSCVAVHVGDIISSDEYSPVSGNVTGFPSAHLDRKYFAIDPYYGSGDAEFGINDDIKKAKDVISVADVSADISSEGEIIDATANVRFLYNDDDSHYSVGYVLVEDGMQNVGWSQSNYYADLKGEGIEDNEPLFEPWVNGENNVTGVIYDDVAIAAQGIEKGVEGSIPSSITNGETYVSTATFDISKYPLIQKPDNLRVIVILFDTKTGIVENSATARLNVETSVMGVDTEEVVETARYAVDGCMISAPQKGINIVKYSDGSTKKVIVR